MGSDDVLLALLSMTTRNVQIRPRISKVAFDPSFAFQSDREKRFPFAVV